MNLEDEILTHFLNNLLMGWAVKTENPYLLLALNFSNSSQILFTPVHNLLEKVTIFFLHVLLVCILNELPKVNRSFKDLRVFLQIIKAFYYLLFVFIYSLVKFMVNVNHTLYLYILVCLLCLDIALPKLVELLQMQKLKMLFTDLLESPIHNLFHFFFKSLFLWAEIESSFLWVISYSNIDPWHASKTFFILLIKLVYFLKNLWNVTNHVYH